MTVTTYSNAMQMDVNPAGEVYSILIDAPHPSCHFDQRGTLGSAACHFDTPPCHFD